MKEHSFVSGIIAIFAGILMPIKSLYMKQPQHVLGLTCPPITHNVRIGLIGLGNRGRATLERYQVLKDAEITALCDLRRQNLDEAQHCLVRHGKNKAVTYTGEQGWRDICRDPAVDLIYICTDWLTHTPMATYAMEQGKHVALEVPAAMTVDECWKLVDTAERTRRHCIMLENCCYDTFALAALSMAQQGMFGEITHCEGAYIHDLRDKYNADENNGGYHKGWMRKYSLLHGGNPYPTHGLGPVCQLLDIHRGDRLDYLVSLSSGSASGRHEHGDHINNTLLRTVKGKSILIQYDVTTPRPYSRMQTICGTRGFAQKYPRRCFMFDGQEAVQGDAVEPLLERFKHPFIATLGEEGLRLGVSNLMNYMMDRRLIHCLKEGLPTDMDVYDAAEWSCITELSEQSALQGSVPVKIPDFTRGRWQELDGFRFA